MLTLNFNRDADPDTLAKEELVEQQLREWLDITNWLRYQMRQHKMYFTDDQYKWVEQRSENYYIRWLNKGRTTILRAFDILHRKPLQQTNGYDDGSIEIYDTSIFSNMNWKLSTELALTQEDLKIMNQYTNSLNSFIQSLSSILPRFRAQSAFA